MPNGRWPRDVHPNVVRRANEVAGMSRAEAIQSLRAAQVELNERLLRHRFNTLPQQIGADPVANAIRTLADDEDADVLLMLRMFVYLYNAADDLERLLAGEQDLARRRTFLRQFCDVVSGFFDAREVVEAGLFEYFARNPGELTPLLKQGFGAIRQVWPCLSARNRRKLMRDVLNSPKGYPKTARSAPAWRPPDQVDVTALITEWLDTGSNTSAFTGMPTFSPTPRDEIGARYAGATPDEKNLMWFGVFDLVARAMDVRGDKDLTRAHVVQHKARLVAGFAGLIAQAEVEHYVDGFDEVYNTFM